MNQKVAWKPLPKQEIALKSNADEILFGGSRGGGKTDAGQAWLLYDIDKAPYRALVVRRNFTDLSDWIDRASQFYRNVGGKFVGDTFKFPSGAQIKTGHLDGKEAYQKYQGHEYHKILIEELTHIPRESDYEKLLASNRSTVPEIKPQIFCTTNPDGPGHEWVKERWDIPDNPTDVIRTETKQGRVRVFVPSRVQDNTILMKTDPGYIEQLKSIQDEELRRAWLEGSWEGFGVEGAYYRNQMQRMREEGRITKVPYDELLDVHTWCDLGVGDAFAIGYFQTTGREWRLIDYDEIEGEGFGYVANLMRSKGYRYGEHYAPHDIKVRELGTGKSRLEVAESLGIRYNIAPKLGIDDGISAVRMRLSTLWADEENCKGWVKAMNHYQKEYDEKRAIFKNKPLHDWASHGADMTRYWGVTNFNNSDILLQQQRQLYQNQSKRAGFK